MLESAVASPMNVKYYAQQENIFQLAANLPEEIMIMSIKALQTLALLLQPINEPANSWAAIPRVL